MPIISPPNFDQPITEGAKLVAYWQRKFSEIFDFAAGRWQNYTPTFTSGTGGALAGVIQVAQTRVQGDSADIHVGLIFHAFPAGVTEIRVTTPVQAPIVPSLGIGALATTIFEPTATVSGAVYLGTDNLLHVRRYDGTAFASGGDVSIAFSGRYRII